MRSLGYARDDNFFARVKGFCSGTGSLLGYRVFIRVQGLYSGWLHRLSSQQSKATRDLKTDTWQMLVQTINKEPLNKELIKKELINTGKQYVYRNYQCPRGTY